MSGKRRIFDLASHFWSRVEKNGPMPSHMPELDQCWVWTGAKISAGYGHIYFDGKLRYAHRVSFGLIHGIDSEEIDGCVLHKCDNKSCVRPDHLFLGTNGSNRKDLSLKGLLSVHNDTARIELATAILNASGTQ